MFFMATFVHIWPNFPTLVESTLHPKRSNLTGKGGSFGKPGRWTRGGRWTSSLHTANSMCAGRNPWPHAPGAFHRRGCAPADEEQRGIQPGSLLHPRNPDLGGGSEVAFKKQRWVSWRSTPFSRHLKNCFFFLQRKTPKIADLGPQK